MRKTRVLWILLAVLALAYIAAGFSRISFNIDILRLLPSHLRQVEGLSLFLKNFALPNELIVTVEASDAESAGDSADTLAKVLRTHPDLVKSAVARPPWEDDPASLSEFLTFLVLNQSAEKMGEIRKKLSPGQAGATLRNTLEELGTSVSPRDIALLSYDPYGLSASLSGAGVFGGTQKSEFSSADGKFRVVYVEAARPFSDYKQTDAWLKRIKKICSGAKVAGHLGFTGEPAFVAEISTGMEWDMITSAIATLVLISLIFWLCYGGFAPLRWLLAMLLLTFVLSLATAGLFLHQITVIGAGFASVMIGLSVDYGYFIYQQSLRHTGDVRGLQWRCLQNIVWTSSTTAAAFFALNLSSLPGLSQLGNMVGIGVCIGAIVMLGVFAPLAMRFRLAARPSAPSRLDPIFSSARFAAAGEWFAVGMVIVLLGALLLRGFPEADFSAATFRPKKSGAQTALENLYSRLTDDRGLLSLIVTGKNEDEVLARLRNVQARLEEAVQRGDLKQFFLPLPLWPDAARQRANLDIMKSLGGELPRLRETLGENGFTEGAFALTSAVFQQAGSWQNRALPIWPDNETSRWILRRIARHHDGTFLALGMVAPGRESELAESFRDEGFYLVSWSALGAELKRTMPREILQVSFALMAGILVILAVGLRSFRAVVLFAATTALVLACLAGAMALLGMTWGFFNMAAVLLLLGTGTDYSILLLLAMRRNGGDAPRARRELGLVIFLCCTSAAAGFGSLAWAGNTGLATLGKTCALGLLIDGVISLFLLPKAWALWFPHKDDRNPFSGC
ncbi:MAG: MMPL family transporter [Verrucomicrobiae bacterium]